MTQLSLSFIQYVSLDVFDVYQCVLYSKVELSQ